MYHTIIKSTIVYKSNLVHVRKEKVQSSNSTYITNLLRKYNVWFPLYITVTEFWSKVN